MRKQKLGERMDPFNSLICILYRGRGQVVPKFVIGSSANQGNEGVSRAEGAGHREGTPMDSRTEEMLKSDVTIIDSRA